MKLHIFNPEHETVMAYGDGVFTSPHATRELRRDLGFIASLWAVDGDFVLVDDIEAALEAVRHIRKYAADVIFVTSNDLKDINFDEIDDFSIEPWGWNKVLKTQLLKSSSALTSYFPSDEKLIDIRNMCNRKFAADHILSFLCEADSEFIGESHYITSMELLDKALSNNENSVLKAPWSSSGRGVRYVGNTLNNPLRGWCNNVISRQGGIMLEPFYNKILDFGMEFIIDKFGHSNYCGLSMFRTVNGAYAGNILATEGYKLKLLERYVSAKRLENIAKLIVHRMDDVVGNDYVGPFGVDMMIVSDGKTDGFRVHPCVELNLRRTMGHVALAISPNEYEGRKLMQISYNGSYKLRIISTNENLLTTSLAVLWDNIT